MPTSIGSQLRGRAVGCAWCDQLMPVFEDLRFIYERMPSDFHGVIHWPGEGLSFAVANAGKRFGHVLADETGVPAYYFGMFLSGGGTIQQGKIVMELGPGEGVILDQSQGCKFDLKDGRLASFRLPVSFFDGCAGGATNVGRKITDCSPWGRVLRESLRAADESLCQTGALQHSFRAHVFGALQMAIGTKEPASADRRHVLAERLAIALFERFFDTMVTPARLAREFGISVRQLHLCFASMGTTFRRELTKARLRRAEAMMVDPNKIRWNLTEIALECGFADASHFRRRFREHYLQTPAQYRRSSTL